MYVCWPGRKQSEGKKVGFLKSEKNEAAERLILQKNFFKAQNPRLINKSGFKLRGAYDGAHTVDIYANYRHPMKA